MLQVKTILKKLIYRRNSKIFDFKRLGFPLFGKIPDKIVSYESHHHDQVNWSKSTQQNIITVHCIRHAESTINALRNHNIETLNIPSLLFKKDPGKFPLFTTTFFLDISQSRDHRRPKSNLIQMHDWIRSQFN